MRTTVGVDFNIDLGEIPGAEGVAQDRELLRLATRVNVACGGHAGDRERIELVCSAAVQAGTMVGAHPGYEDRDHFGRRELGLTAADLAAQAASQLALMLEVAGPADVAISHVKPHGAMYHRLAHDSEAATLFCTEISALAPGTSIIGPPQSALLLAASRLGLPTLGECFADRAYTRDGQLADRTLERAVLAPEAAAEQALALASGATFATLDGGEIAVQAQTICVHGDGENAVATAQAVAAALGLER